jgi:uncharacterized DUF497 family protein
VIYQWDPKKAAANLKKHKGQKPTHRKSKRDR